MANNLARIWDTDPDARPKARSTYSDDVVGRFRSGRMVGKLPEALTAWRVTTGDPVVAATVVDLFGGVAEEWETDKEDNLEVLTDAPSARIIIASSSAVDASMKLFGMQGLAHHCDGVEYLSPEEDKGTPCGCPASFQERKDRARAGRGPKPSVDVLFKLADAPELGKFRFNTGSWDMVKTLHEVIEAIDVTGGADDDGKGGAPVLATLSIENVSYTTKAGRDVSYHKPVVKVLGLAADAGSPDLAKAA